MNSPMAATILEAAGGDPMAINGPMITQAAKAGDRLCVETFETIGRWLGQGLADLACVFDPSVVVISIRWDLPSTLTICEVINEIKLLPVFHGEKMPAGR